MIQKVKTYVFAAMMALTLSVPALVPAVASALAAGCNDISSNIASGANQAATGSSTGGGTNSITCDSTGVSGSNIGHAANSLVNIFSIIVGVAAVVMIIYGGFRYITSGGDSGRVGSAKNSLIYAIIGLIIVALAQLIVHFVLNQSTQITAPA